MSVPQRPKSCTPRLARPRHGPAVMGPAVVVVVVVAVAWRGEPSGAVAPGRGGGVR